MAQDIRLHQLALAYLYRNRLSSAHQLLDHYGSAADVWQHIDEPDMKKALTIAERELEWMEKHGIQSCFLHDEAYPYRLRQCPDAPLVLYCKGNVEPNKGKFLSVVGTRTATDRGRELTRSIILDLKQLVPDLTIVSGLAYGIDIAAHKAALEAGLPTIIVPGHGLDRIYPQLHRNVAVEALKEGGILTEYMSGTEPIGANFVARDRIIAGLADAVLVAESKVRGGSLITAQMALDYDRQLFAIPGRPSDEQSKGCNALIRDQKAALVETAEDLVMAMMWETAQVKQPVQTEMVDLWQDLDDTERVILQKLREQEDGIHVNLIVMECGLSYAVVSSTLMMMELKGIVKGLPGGIYRTLK